MTDTQDSALARKIAGTRAAQRYSFDERSIIRIVGLLTHFRGSAEDPALKSTSVKAQLEALDDALNAVNAAWWDVVRNPRAFSAIAGHYCDEATQRDECLDRLRAALDLEPVRFAVRLARRLPWNEAGARVEPPYGSGVRPSDPERLVRRLYELTRTLAGPSKTDEERRVIVLELLEIIDIELDPMTLDEMLAAA